LLFIIAMGVALVASGCGGAMSNPAPGGGTTSLPPGGGAGTTAAQVRLGDAPADRVISFEVSVGPITMKPTNGAAVTVLSSTRRLELTHLSATSEPLALLNVPQGSYSSATLTVANPEIVFINNVGQIVKLEPAFNQAITMNFSPTFNAGATAPMVNIDLNVAKSLTFDGQGNITGVNISASSFNLSSTTVAPESEQEFESGELEDTSGTVTSVNGTSFVLTLGVSGSVLTFATDSNTQFKDGATLTTMLNTVVTVEGVTRSDGTLYAKEVEGVENVGGAEIEGLITQVSGNPATQLTYTADDGSGSGMDDTKVGANFTVDVSGAGYKVQAGHIDNSGIGSLPAPPTFPFDASTIHPGQRIEIETSSAVTGNSLVADKVSLQPQTLSGTISGLSGSAPATFIVTVAPDSAFAMLSGSTTVIVHWQPKTDLHNLPHPLSNGDAVRIRGLVFFSGTSFNMIARRIMP
jgi:hypothetical protein